MNIHAIISDQIHKAMLAAGVPPYYRVQVRPSVKKKFGDYQINGLMATAKQLGVPSYFLAKKVVSFLQLNGIARQIDIAGPGFINIYLDSQWLATKIATAIASPRLGISLIELPQTIVVDYSSPNIAKEMHVGHIRSTIIGDASARILDFIGHKVIRINHIGDWGTHFGMLIAYLQQVEKNIDPEIPLSFLDQLYRQAKDKYDTDPSFAQEARNCVVKLQCGDSFCLKIWQKLVKITINENQKIYNRLNISLSHENIMGESKYNNMLPNIIADLKAKGLAVESAGATVIFLNEFQDKQGNPLGVIIQKKDGAYLYTTTDIACIKYRYEQLKADRIIYYVDSRQHQHLKQIWTIVRKAGYIPQTMQLDHHMFGMIFDKEGKPFKTRVGVNIKLNDLLDEALKRARCLILSKNMDVDPVELEHLAQVISISAIKYAELSKNRTTDYIFNWDDMLSFEGNTAPYILYAYTRIASILKRSNYNKQQILTGSILLEKEHEHLLAVRLLQYHETITTVAHDGRPHILCGYLYNLAVRFSSFYEHCSIINANSDIQRKSRLQLALLTSKTLQHGLSLLGIETVDKM
ncbi:arginine--tRNA ligase [Candidatus Palibaumannia cicadellinicola]|uniref:Arginine--tRNA ligase n=1 Tax=Baumannia cicadellinicola subsp. Homalodisca coagulata TaxID=374463 RepID=SYR_BAUCH|nr:arginine--tRNA ligase [Candidatus Baumannia cicadellinicola]Q1LTI8.1 RecName: Full=Arginine--tRNA ligase; AltName: Full=Arginyl-tRNA synthetase; Short=ArgRS [Baumannia cicadellinicola str. Hc (Homalodisca coagulata)]ABF13938.1 arginyl-tRNA synthetase [Baumannia cicadellinicola str. Hc (Homalodisca coagulata)]MCJ7462290.1 arginine--tRNA ligase [Candidatus Baumannia cicadellinicola]MCJ7462810.1 arginine--tRNA ligase [Candidatus Baumannia cicadellinicola]